MKQTNKQKENSSDMRDVEALQLYRELFATKLQLDLIVFNATVSACEKGGQWEAALRLLQD